MIFTSYIDESDTHGSSPNITLAAVVSDSKRWEICERKLANIQREFGFSIFHGTTFAALKGEFEDWSGRKCYDLLMALGNLVAKYVVECITVSCEYEIYEKHFLEVLPRKMHKTSQYGICFLAMIDALTKVVTGQGDHQKLSVVIESGHKNANDTKRLFEQRKQNLENFGMNFLRSHSLLKKEQCPLLMLADITSHGHALERKAVRSGRAAQFSDRGSPEPRRGETGWTIYDVTPEYLTSLINEFASGRAAAHEAYMQRKLAWLQANREHKDGFY